MSQRSLADETVGVVVPTIPTPARNRLVRQAVASVMRQSHAAAELHVHSDVGRRGAAATRNRGVFASRRCRWVAFLDDDDIMYAHHLQALVSAARMTGADVVYPWFDVDAFQDGRRKPFEFLTVDGATAEGRPFDEASRATLLGLHNFVPVTVLARTEAVLDVGGFPRPGTPSWPHEANEELGLWVRLLEAGAKFHHLNERTWQWRWHADHTNGRPDRW